MDFNQTLLGRNALTGGDDDNRPGYYKIIGLSLAIGSGVFIGTSFVLKKVGLLRANEKYNEVAGEGYGYLRNAYWWSGMTLMIIGEICNFVAYAFTDAILVTPLGALSVVITTVLSAIFLKERLSMVGKVACFLCIVGSVIIVMNAPQESSVKDIKEMQHYVITPGFLTYAGIILVGSAITAFFVGPKYGKKNMLVYISICSWVGGLSVVATQGLGAAIIAWINGEPEYKEWFLWVLLVFVVGTLLTEIIFLNKALNLFNAALVTPTYYVYFTSTTIITSAILFQGFKGSVESIVTVVLGFLVICAGVVLLQLSKSAKDVPDAAVFQGDLDQVQTIAEQEQPETEPKADAIRGTAAIVRRISQARIKMEANELKRLHEDKRAEAMEPISENGGQAQYEWDGLRRRRTFASSQRSRSMTSPPPSARSPVPRVNTPHPPLGMSQFPPSDDDEEDDEENHVPFFSSIVGTLRGRARTNATMPTYADEYDQQQRLPASPLPSTTSGDHKRVSEQHQQPVPLSEISIPGQSRSAHDDVGSSYFGRREPHSILSHFSRHHHPHSTPALHSQDTEYRSSAFGSRQSAHTSANSLAPTPPPHSARRQFSFQRVFKRTPGPSEEERVGLVKEDSHDEGRGSEDSHHDGRVYSHEKQRNSLSSDERASYEEESERRREAGGSGSGGPRRPAFI